MDKQRLERLLKFDATDLSANRNGSLSEGQTKRLMSDALTERKSARESAGILLFIAAMGFWFGLLIVVTAPILSARILIGLLLCVLWPLAWGWKAWQVIKSAPAMAEQVRAVRGRVRVVRYEDDFVLEVEGRQFDLEKNPSELIAEGDELIVYYLERTEEILSVEAV